MFIERLFYNMGCCENRFLSSDIILFPEKTAEVRRESFDSLSLYSEGSECKKLAETTNNVNSYFGKSFGSAEMAFMYGNNKSRTQSIIINIDDE